ncbi:P-loop containing nucleoside triphosphate hydrolase protein [Auriscalpium vulgare]|uniref:P-loop containing nucleoside triphosphate hydrolase protein n=1 Tax=Auriscalpium vulgare TaxID=40419 RepID=A0ACB8RN46_9AGAM|nr:P-loop containing nucleoside triphosphate hydrolase protein [Auriscalpium vulgare]
MDDTQVVLNAGRSVFSTALYYVRQSNAIWLHPFVIPAYVAAASALTWVIGLLISHGPLAARLSTPNEEPAESEARPGFVSEVKEHIEKLGGNTIFVFKFLRLLSVVALLGLQVASFERAKDGYTKREWNDLILTITYLYASFLAVLSVAAAYKRATTAARHLTIVLLSAFAVYAYRDLWPLATFTLAPLDQREGSLLWARIAVLGIASILIPLAIPRKYVPHDPKDPSPEPNPEQTAPILSMALYTFLDPIIFLANRVPHLSHDQLPPIADYDHARNLVQRSFKHLDVFSGSPKRHLFFGFMKVFSREYIALTFLISLKAVTGFFGPLGINRLLAYLETHGEGAVVRPWVWISCLLLGPLLGTVTLQWYIFIGTGILVRVEGIITQLVFEHALRIRMKAETSKSGTSTVNTPDNRSVTSSPELESENTAEPGHPIEEGSNGSRDETVRASTPSTHSSNAKGKGKAKDSEAKTPEPGANKQESNLVGKINNLVSTDLNNITDGRNFLFLILYMPFQLALCIWFLYAILGWSAFVGMAVMIALFPLPGYVSKVIQTVQKETMKKTDARVQAVTETMGVLRMIKLFGWEPKIDDKVAEKRDLELKFIKKRQLLNLLNGDLNYVIPIFVMIATFTVYTGIMKQSMKPSTVFSSMAVFDLMRDQLHGIFYMIPTLIQAKVSLDRVDEFLHETELLDEFAGPEDEAARALLSDASRFDEDVIGFENASFTWSTEDASDGAATPSSRKFTLRIDDRLQFKRGAINLIIGPTGSGKTSLLMALLGEMHFVPLGPRSWYHLPRKGGVAYAAQESWVQNETIRDNILFGAPYDEARYEKVVHQCGLKRDLSLFEAGDKTEVGEKGLTLSGGQKARVTLARAIYSSAEIILLDDVLAALDVHTARWIVDKCFKGDLIRGRTVILVTHNVAMASPIAEYVVSLGLDGTIVSRGSVSEALAKDEILQEELQEELQEIQADDKEIDAESPDEKAKQADGKLILAEEVAEGHVSWDSLKLFFKALGGSHVTLFWIVFLGGMILCDGAMSAQTWWMGYWAEQYDLVTDPSEVNIAYYLAIFCLLCAIGITVYTIGTAVYVFGALRASKSIHRRLMQSVLGTTLRWLDTTPTSRVIARCTQDIRALDGPVADALCGVVEISVAMMIKLGAVVLLTPVFLIPGVLVFALGGWCGQIYMRAQIAVKREQSNARAPVLGHFGAAIAGLTSIRAYGAQAAFRQESYKRIDRYTRAARVFWDLNRWVSLRIDILGGVFASALGAWLIYGPEGSTALPSNTGFSLNMAVGFSGMIIWWVRMLNHFEVQGNSLERILAYMKIEQEPKSTKDGVPPAYWPASGDLRVEKLSARYSEDGPKVLHDVSFHIQSGERVGVVGRTGSGKSTLTLSLLRGIFTEGTVYFDGIPTSSVNLEALRSSITIIPQMPELLSGTLRENLDPFDQHDDATLNSALRAAGLFSLQAEDDDSRVTLDSAIAGGGGNLSVGQRQILALARAIVRGSKLLILDEATSAIDYATDTIIQSSLRNELKGDVTLITIAHRLQTIMDADKIMVLDAGRIVEFGTPSELLKIEDGRLRSLVDESGDKEVLYAMAASHQHARDVTLIGQSS